MLGGKGKPVRQVVQNTNSVKFLSFHRNKDVCVCMCVCVSTNLLENHIHILAAIDLIHVHVL